MATSGTTSSRSSVTARSHPSARARSRRGCAAAPRSSRRRRWRSSTGSSPPSSTQPSTIASSAATRPPESGSPASTTRGATADRRAGRGTDRRHARALPRSGRARGRNWPAPRRVLRPDRRPRRLPSPHRHGRPPARPRRHWPPQFGPPKTEASVRTVPLPDVVGSALAAHLEQLARRRRWPDLHQRQRRARSAATASARSGALRSARAGLDGLRFHDLRHFYASLLIRHGESVKVVQARLGHASASETLDTYSHLWPDNEERTRAAVEEILGRRSNDHTVVTEQRPGFPSDRFDLNER